MEKITAEVTCYPDGSGNPTINFSCQRLVLPTHDMYNVLLLNPCLGCTKYQPGDGPFIASVYVDPSKDRVLACAPRSHGVTEKEVILSCVFPKKEKN